MVYIGNYSKCAWKMYILLLFGGVFCISLRSLCLYQILSSYFIHYWKLILTCTIIVSFFLLSFPSVCFNILKLCYLMYIWLWLLYLLGELTFSQYIMLFFVSCNSFWLISQNISIAPPALLWILFAWDSFPHPFIFNILMSLDVKLISYREHIFRSCLFLKSHLPIHTFWSENLIPLHLITDDKDLHSPFSHFIVFRMS